MLGRTDGFDADAVPLDTCCPLCPFWALAHLTKHWDSFHFTETRGHASRQTLAMPYQ